MKINSNHITLSMLLLMGAYSIWLLKKAYTKKIIINNKTMMNARIIKLMIGSILGWFLGLLIHDLATMKSGDDGTLTLIYFIPYFLCAFGGIIFMIKKRKNTQEEFNNKIKSDGE